jgi:hypothetical protein
MEEIKFDFVSPELGENLEEMKGIMKRRRRNPPLAG